GLNQSAWRCIAADEIRPGDWSARSNTAMRKAAFRVLLRLLRVVKRLSVSVNMNLLSLHKGDVPGNHHHGHMPSHCMEQGQAHRPEISAEAERDLGNPDSVA